jgi:hypothetical protein
MGKERKDEVQAQKDRKHHFNNMVIPDPETLFEIIEGERELQQGGNRSLTWEQVRKLLKDGENKD